MFPFSLKRLTMMIVLCATLFMGIGMAGIQTAQANLVMVVSDISVPVGGTEATALAGNAASHLATAYHANCTRHEHNHVATFITPIAPDFVAAQTGGRFGVYRALYKVPWRVTKQTQV